MAAPFDVKFEVTGPVFDGSGLRVMQGIINRGLLDLATIEGSNQVKDQLYPGPGGCTGNQAGRPCTAPIRSKGPYWPI
jgi:hypothetical protein